MTGDREHRREGQRPRPLPPVRLDHPAQGVGGDRPPRHRLRVGMAETLVEAAGDGHRVAVEVQGQGRDHGLARAHHTERAGQGHGAEHLRAVQGTELDLVPHVRP